jgi:hypothetical protein
MPDRSGKRPRDVNELAKQLVDEAIGERPKKAPQKRGPYKKRKV